MQHAISAVSCRPLNHCLNVSDLASMDSFSVCINALA